MWFDSRQEQETDYFSKRPDQPCGLPLGLSSPAMKLATQTKQKMPHLPTAFVASKEMTIPLLKLHSYQRQPTKCSCSFRREENSFGAHATHSDRQQKRLVLWPPRSPNLTPAHLHPSHYLVIYFVIK